MIIWVAVDCKSDTRQTRTCFINTKRRNIQLIQHAKMYHVDCFGLNPGWKKMQYQLALNTTKEQKLMKQYFLPPRHRISLQSTQNQNWKSNKYFILTVIELGPPLSGSLFKISKLYAPTDSKHRFNKARMENLFTHRIRGAYSHNHFTMFNC